VKKFIAISLLFLYLFSATEFSQLLKLPILVEHYMEHKAEDSNISIWQFLCIHYANGNVVDADYEKDLKLPFKTHDNCNCTFFVLVPNISHHFSLNTFVPVFVKTKVLTPYQPSFLGSSYLNTIWQPPKSC
jgi:hypothetical protein